MAKRQPKTLLAHELATTDALLLVGNDGEIYAWNEAGEETILTGSQAVSNAGRLVAELRSISGTVEGEPRTLKGFTAAGDGGGGLFQWRTGTATDDDGTILNQNGYGQPALGYWERVYSGPRDVRWFGAFTDGSDASTALARAFAGGGSVVAPPGTYTLDTALALVSNLDLTAYGATFRAKAATTYNAVLTGASISNVTIRGLTVDANGPNRTDAANTKDGFRIVGLTDALFDGVTVKNTRGTPGSAVGYALTNGLRVRYVNCLAIDCGVAGHISDGWYSNGEKILFNNCIAEHCQDTGFVFENATESGGVNLRVDGVGTGAGIAIGVAGNTDKRDNFFSDVIIREVIAPIEFGLFGASTNTGQLIGTRFDNVIVDSSTSGFPALLCYPNAQVNPANTFTADSGTNVITSAGHGLSDDMRVFVSNSGGALPGGLDNLTRYYVISAALDTFKLSLTQGGGEINITSDGTGTNSWIHVYEGRIVDTVVNGFQVEQNSGSQGILITNADDFTVRGCNMHVTAAAIQTGEGNPTALVLDDNVCDVTGSATIGIQLDHGCDDVTIRHNRIRGGANMVHGVYIFDTCSDVKLGPNLITSAASLANPSGISIQSTASDVKGFTHPDPAFLGTYAFPGANGESGYVIGRSGEYGGVQHDPGAGVGVLRYGASVRGELGISSGSVPWASWTPGLYWRSNGTITAVGVNRDPSDRAAFMSVAAGSTSNWQACLEAGVATTTALAGGLSHVSGTGLEFVYGGVRFVLAGPLIGPLEPETDAATIDQVFSGQHAKTGAITNKDGSHAILKGGTKAAGGINGSAKLQNGDGNTVVEAADGNKLGFFATTPAARTSGYTQTYSTASRTHAAYTSDPESGAYTGIDNTQVGTVYATVADLNTLRVAYENLRVAYESTSAVLNQVLDDLQTYGLLQ